MTVNRKFPGRTLNHWLLGPVVLAMLFATGCPPVPPQDPTVMHIQIPSITTPFVNGSSGANDSGICRPDEVITSLIVDSGVIVDSIDVICTNVTDATIVDSGRLPAVSQRQHQVHISSGI